MICDLEGDRKQVLEQFDSDDDSDCEHIECSICMNCHLGQLLSLAI